MINKKHIGFSSLHAERRKLLSEYDTIKESLNDDPIMVEHGIKAEAQFRKFLEQFLPKKYGVTKGYIITPKIDYEGPLEEWDIIIYDALESPVLFIRNNEDNSLKRGIPVEYVRAVIEVKATFDKENCKKATQKLLKLRKFTKNGNTDDLSVNDSLKHPFTAFTVFYEVKVKTKKEYLDALKEHTRFRMDDPLVQYIGGIILRADKYPDYSTEISLIMAGFPDVQRMLVKGCEACEGVPSFVEGLYASFYSCGFGENVFWYFLMNLVHYLNGEMEEHDSPINFTGQYGQNPNSAELKPLFDS